MQTIDTAIPPIEQGQFSLASGDYQSAYDSFKNALETSDHATPAVSIEVCLTGLCDSAIGLKNFDEAAEYLQRLITIKQNASHRNEIELLKLHARLALVLSVSGWHAQAVSLMDRVVSAARQRLPLNHSEYLSLLERFEVIASNSGNEAKLEEVRNKLNASRTYAAQKLAARLASVKDALLDAQPTPVGAITTQEKLDPKHLARPSSAPDYKEREKVRSLYRVQGLTLDNRRFPSEPISKRDCGKLLTAETLGVVISILIPVACVISLIFLVIALAGGHS